MTAFRIWLSGLLYWLAQMVDPIPKAPVTVPEAASPAPVSTPDEGHTGGQFRVITDFTIRREHDRAVLNEGNAPVLGHYWAGHDYSITRLNASAVLAAVGQGLALVILPPKESA